MSVFPTKPHSECALRHPLTGEPATSQAPEGRMKKNDPYREIGRRLRRLFDDVVNEPLPEELMALVRKLEADKDDAGINS